MKGIGQSGAWLQFYVCYILYECVTMTECELYR